MRANSMCISCMLSKQEQQIRNFTEEEKKSEYMHQVLEILYKYGQTESSPALAEQLNQLYEDFWGEPIDYTPVKHRYNQLLLAKESELDALISASTDPLKECIKYVCAANYIDFSAVKDVNEETFRQLLDAAETEDISPEEYQYFRNDLRLAKKLVYLTDNCGEIVLDKLFIRHIKEEFPNLQITAIVRGRHVLNDATMEDADEVGLTALVSCIGNGTGAPGTVLKRLSEDARQKLTEADIIISKGQGNFESLHGEGLNPYYMFLCKCELFVRRFGLEQFESVFRKEERI